MIETVNMHQQLESLVRDRFYSMYPVPLHLDQVISKHGYSLEQYQQPEIQQQVAQHQLDEYYQTIDWLLDHQCRVVVLDQDPQFQTYTALPRQFDRMLLQGRPPQSQQELLDEKNSTYFQSSIDTWNKLQLNNIWDQRERDALNIRPFKTNKFECNFARPVCRINSLELWGFGPQVIAKVMNFLQLDINTQRFEQWHSVYRKWQSLQFKILDFVINLDYIVEAIINNWYYKLPDLTYQQEVILQHCLIYQHGLNLKTWQLEKFPNNTQQLHELLEINTHPIEKIYN